LTGGVPTAASLWIGGILGAALLTTIAAWVATRPTYLRTLRAVLLGKDPSAAHSIWERVSMFAAQLMAARLSPRIVPLARADGAGRRREQIEPVARHCAELVFFWCWSLRRPDATPRPETTGPLPAAMLDALTVLYARVRSGQPSAEEADCAAALLQIAEDE